jgi:hypothetical protein
MNSVKRESLDWSKQEFPLLSELEPRIRLVPPVTLLTRTKLVLQD